MAFQPRVAALAISLLNPLLPCFCPAAPLHAPSSFFHCL
jgi:hypothetical protein